VPVERYSPLRIDRGPRGVVKLHGVERPFTPNRLPVDTPQVRQIRVGYHPAPEGGELHLVLDLASPEVVLLAAEGGGRSLRLLLGPG
jgi:hypothetical protein